MASRRDLDGRGERLDRREFLELLGRVFGLGGVVLALLSAAGCEGGDDDDDDDGGRRRRRRR